MNDSYIHSNSDEYTQMLTSLLKHSFDTFTNFDNLHFTIDWTFFLIVIDYNDNKDTYIRFSFK